MLELLNIRFSYFLRATRKNLEGQSPVILRIIFRGERRDIFTGLYCDDKDWDSKSGRLPKEKRNQAFNSNLELIQRKAYQVFEEMCYSGVAFTIDELVDKIKGKEERPVYLMDYLESEKKRLKKRLGSDISPATYDKYRRSASHVQLFLQDEFKIKNYALQRIDASFLEKYFWYLRNARKISHNTSVKYITFFKTILMPAIRAGVFKEDPFRQIKLRQKPVYKGYLTREEIDTIAGIDLQSKDLDRIRDIFLFACYTGLAYSDLKQLSRIHILKDNDESYFIRKPRQKTGQESIIPLLPAAISILGKHSLTSDFRDFSWYVSANQKMNQRLKVIAEKAGIGKELHMHLARHTFATTVTLANGVPIETVSSMLGHASLKQTQHYAKIIAQKVKGDMAKLNGIFK